MKSQVLWPDPAGRVALHRALVAGVSLSFAPARSRAELATT